MRIFRIDDNGFLKIRLLIASHISSLRYSRANQWRNGMQTKTTLTIVSLIG